MISRIFHRPGLVKVAVLSVCLLVPCADVRAGLDDQPDSGVSQTNAADNGAEIRPILASLVREGVDAYEGGRLDRAIDRFSRAMLLDPFQETARRYLVLINQRKGLTAKQRAELFLFENLTAFLDDLNEKKENLSRKCDDLVEGAVRAGADRFSVEAALAKISDNFLSSEEYWQAGGDSRPPLEALNAAFMRKKKDLSVRLLSLHKKHAWLADKKWEAVMVVPDEGLTLEPFFLPDGHTPPAVAVESVVADASDASYDEIVLMRAELQDLRKELDKLYSDVQKKDAKISYLSGQVVEFSLKLTEQETVLNEKARLTDALNEQYADIQSRLELGQKIIQDKNAQIQALQDGLTSLQAETAAHQKELSEMLVRKDGEVQELTGIMQIYKSKLGDVYDRLERKQENIADLESAVEAMRVALFERETALNKTKARMVMLEEQLNDMQRELSRKQKRSSRDSRKDEALEDRFYGLGSELRDIHNFKSRQADSMSRREEETAVPDRGRIDPVGF